MELQLKIFSDKIINIVMYLFCFFVYNYKVHDSYITDMKDFIFHIEIFFIIFIIYL